MRSEESNRKGMLGVAFCVATNFFVCFQYERQEAFLAEEIERAQN